MDDRGEEPVGSPSPTDAGGVDRCANCESALAPTEWHPVVTTTDDEGTLVFYSFCDERCEDEWTDE